MTRHYGRAERGKRAVDKAPRGYKSLTVVAALKHDGIKAPAVFDGSLDGNCFAAYGEQILSPILNKDDIIIIDNLSCHKNLIFRKIVEDFGAKVLFLPSYSPDYNPIELAFSKIKQKFRDEKIRCLEKLQDRIDPIMNLVDAEESANFFRHCGYELE
jgi:transposase